MIGIDEVGRGCWAGPLLVVAARQIGALPEGLDDSKKLTKNKRQKFSQDLAMVCEFGEGWVEPNEIDKLGLTNAMKLGVKRALEALKSVFDEPIIMDGLVNYCAPEFKNVQCVVRADADYPIVSAASIRAKVLRDAVMVQLASQYPDYGFEQHVGYGTKAHRRSLELYGATPIHRFSYKPVQQFVIS